MKVKPRNALLCMPLVCIRRYLISVLRYTFLILDTYSDTPYLRQQVYEDTWLFLGAKRGRLATQFRKHWARRSGVRPGKDISLFFKMLRLDKERGKLIAYTSREEDWPVRKCDLANKYLHQFKQFTNSIDFEKL